MTINEIESYLALKNTQLDEFVRDQIEKFRLDAINSKNELQANYCWCLKQIFDIQKDFLSSINFLKDKEYEKAWCTLEQIEISLGNLEENFEIVQGSDKYHLVFIKQIIKEYQKLFPYRYFFSRECIIKSEKCSICDQPISLRNSCGHKVGKLYMGEICCRKVTDFEFKAVCIVTDPFDKYAYLKIDDKEYNYGMLENLMKEIDNPYESFFIEITKEKNPMYKNVGRNAQCPCGSGKKYKKCHLGTKSELMDHYIVNMPKLRMRKSKFVGNFGTWK